jgi:hypothetical protein
VPGDGLRPHPVRTFDASFPVTRKRERQQNKGAVTFMFSLSEAWQGKLK